MTDPAHSPQATVMPDVFRGLFETHFDYVFHSLRRLGVHERDLEDVTHDMFLEVHARIDRYDTARPAKPWLFAFAVRFASDYRRLARHRITLDGDAGAHLASTTFDAAHALEQREERDLVLRALDEIDLERRAVLVLHDIDEVAVPEIAETLGVPLNTAYSRLRSARALFTEAVRRLRARQR